MAITSVGYGGTVDYPDYGRGVVLPARYSFDDPTHFRPSRVTGGADRTVRITGGTAQGWGIRDTEADASADVQLGSISSGSRWDLIGLSRDWSAEESSLVVVNGGSSEAIPSRDTDPGVKDVQPIALARVQAGQQYVTDVIDLRCWAADGGLVAVNTRALDYLDTPGTRVSIGATTYTRILSPAGAASWDVKSPPADTGWRDLARGRGGYYSAGKYRVKGGWACLNVDLTCASNRPAGTVEIAPANSAYAHTGNNDMRGILYCNTDSSAVAARVYQSGRIVAYALPSMPEGDRIYGTLTYPTN